MARYFFNIRDGWEVIPDEEGMVFPDNAHAEAEGYASARDLGIAAVREVRGFAAYAVEVTDEVGVVLRRIKVAPVYRAA